MYKSTISAFQHILTNFTFNSENGFPENFASQRFMKKMAVPDLSVTNRLKQECWDNWLEFDRQLHVSDIGHEWRRARIDLSQINSLRSEDFSGFFPEGSSFKPTMGFNSIEAWLCANDWTVTKDCFDMFAHTIYGHKALKRAFRQRYKRWFTNSVTQQQTFYKDTIKHRAAFDSFLFKKLKTPFKIFRWKLSMIVTFEQGSRFSTVPKNNLVRRPINMECFGNMMVQRSIGVHLRRELKRLYRIDLDTLATTHRARLKDKTIATIDLKNASDSILLDFVERMLPHSLVTQLKRSRSEMILGPDGNYYHIRKVSSMGNGFTFELMTLLLTALVKTLDPSGTVFGDDIIIKNDCAPRLIQLLNEVGFVVNTDKSFIDSPFRESCGGNYHDDFGYIESYDFLYPENIHDCIVIYNKVVALSAYKSFNALAKVLTRVLPEGRALQGPKTDLLSFSFEKDNDPHRLARELGCYFMTGKTPRGALSRKVSKYVERLKKDLQYDQVKAFKGLIWETELRTPTNTSLNSRQWAKYELYMHSLRVAKDQRVGYGRWVEVSLYDVGGNIIRHNAKS